MIFPALFPLYTEVGGDIITIRGQDHVTVMAEEDTGGTLGRVAHEAGVTSVTGSTRQEAREGQVPEKSIGEDEGDLI